MPQHKINCLDIHIKLFSAPEMYLEFEFVLRVISMEFFPRSSFFHFLQFFGEHLILFGGVRPQVISAQ